MGSPPAEAVQLKDEGNKAFKNQEWDKALEFYTKAIEAYDAEPSFYTNRAQVRCLFAPPHKAQLYANLRSRHTSSSNSTDMLYKTQTRPLNSTPTMSRYHIPHPWLLIMALTTFPAGILSSRLGQHGHPQAS